MRYGASKGGDIMTHEEKLQYIENMQNSLCELCQTYEAADCTGCPFARPIDVAGRYGTIVCTRNEQSYCDVVVVFDDTNTQAGVMIVGGEPVAVYDEDMVRLGNAPAEDFVDWAGCYDVVTVDDWNRFRPSHWNGNEWVNN